MTIVFNIIVLEVLLQELLWTLTALNRSCSKMVATLGGKCSKLKLYFDHNYSKYSYFNQKLFWA